MRNKFLGTGTPGYHPLRKLRIIVSGLRYAIIYDLAVAYKVVLSVAVLAVCFHYRHWVDFGLLLLATAFMLVSEMFNTSIEALCDFVETKQNEKIMVIKDISAAAVGVSIFAWAVVLVIEAARVLQEMR